MVNNKTILILVIINIALVVILILGLIWIFSGGGSGKSVKYAPILVTGGPVYTLTEIIENGKQDVSFCNKVNGVDKEICINENIRYRAELQNNSAICEESPNSEFVEMCKEGLA